MEYMMALEMCLSIWAKMKNGVSIVPLVKTSEKS